MYDLFTRSVERAVLCTGFADCTYPLIRMHAKDTRFIPTVERLRRDARIHVIARNGGPSWYLSPIAMASLLSHSDGEYERSDDSRARLREVLNSATLANGHRLTSGGRLDLAAFEGILFDLGGVIVDESDLDAAICQYFADNLPRDCPWHSYAEYADELERKADTKWYDYFAQASDLGFPSTVVEELHRQHLSKVRFFPYAVDLLRTLKNSAVPLYLVTGCNSRVLDLRLELYGLEGMFVHCFTSDRGGEIGNKEPLFAECLRSTGLLPRRVLVVTDGYAKDALPALRVGITPLLFASGGRRNAAFKSNGIFPADEIVLSMMATQHNTAVDYVFTSFRALMR